MADKPPHPPFDHNSDSKLNPDPIIIIGAGVFGLSTTLSILQRRKNPSLTPSSPSHHSSPDISHLLHTAPIHILDSSPTVPNPVGSSVDSSRIIRADYASPIYSSLAREAQGLWRDLSPEGWGGEGRYAESGFVVTADRDREHDRQLGKDDGEGKVVDDEGYGKRYVASALENVRAQQLPAHGQQMSTAKAVEELPTPRSIRNVTGYAGAMGDFGYVNWGSGWADAEACISFAVERIRQEDTDGRVKISTGKRVERLLFGPTSGLDSDCSTTKIDNGRSSGRGSRCTGVQLSDPDHTILNASLVILAAGAWTPSLIDLRGRATATGQVLAYIELDEQEQDMLAERPVLMNMSRGMFIMPPPRPRTGVKGRKRELKIARHGFGYRNLQRVRHLGNIGVDDSAKSGEEEVAEDAIEISVPETSIPIPYEGERACREMLREAFSESFPASSQSDTNSNAQPNPDSTPEIMQQRQPLHKLSERPFSRTRICWYCDTPSGDFLITHHPAHPSLFLATGGSGHAFKFLPVIGDLIVDALEGRLDPQLQGLWGWGDDEGVGVTGWEEKGVEDGSRGGRRGMRLWDEVGKGNPD